MIEFTALIIGTLMTALIALVVFLKNSHSITNKLFMSLAVSLIGWSAATYLSLHAANDSQTLFWIRLVMFFVVLQNTSFLLLVRVFPANQFNLFKDKRFVIGLAYSFITAAVALSPFLFVDFQDGAPVPGPGMLLFLPHALLCVIGGLAALIIRYRRARGIEKAQLQYFLAGTVLLFTLLPVGNFIVPLVFKLSQFVVFSPLYSIVFSALIAYAIVKHRLFDIRLAIARTLAYLLLLIALAIIYALAVFGVIQLFFNDQQVGLAQNITYVTLAVFLAFTFEPLKRFFRRLTNKIFFQDAYETKMVLDGITSILVRTVAVDKIAQQSLTILNQALKTQYAAITIVDGSDHPAGRSIAVGRKNQNLHEVLSELQKQPHSLVILDEIAKQSDAMYKVMHRNNVAVAAKLATSEEAIGYLFFGHKQSGNVYTSQDIELIRIVTDELAVAVQNALRFEEITHFNQTLQHEVNEATKQLRQSNKKLQALDEAKDEFISMASHQLRTPLTSVKGYLSMALEGDGGELKPEQRKLLQEAYSSSQRMVYMIADFLNVSRLKTGKFLLEISSVHLPKLIQEEVAQLGAAAKGRGLQLDVSLPSQFPALRLDENKIRQVVMNFIDNAVFYSKSGGTITISLHAKDDEVVFTVKDHGIGVPASEQQGVFTKFFRATNARHARPDGTGIGLFMAEKVIHAHGGEVIFKSEENKGSTFGFRLPLKPELKDQPNKLKQ